MAASRARPRRTARGWRRCRRFLALPSADRLLLLQALCTVIVVRLALWILPPRHAMSRALRVQQWYVGARSNTGWPVDRIAWAVRAVSPLVPMATCLTQALATQLLIARNGGASRLGIGVARDERGEFRAHAWVEVGDRVVIGGGSLGQYTRLPDLGPTS
jgi:hypothetical protein